MKLFTLIFSLVWEKLFSYPSKPALSKRNFNITTINKYFNVRFITRLSSTRGKNIFLLVFLPACGDQPTNKNNKTMTPHNLSQFCST